MGGVVSGLVPELLLPWPEGAQRPPPALLRLAPASPVEQLPAGHLQSDREVGEGGKVCKSVKKRESKESPLHF